MPANFTKKAIMEAFLVLAAKKPLSKITVKDIVDECGINRNTFYYHFQDIYALVDEFFISEAEAVLENVKRGNTWTDVFIEVTEALENEKAAIQNFYRNLGKEQIEKYLCTIAESFVMRMMQSLDGYSELTDKKRELISSFYAYALCGMCIEWLDGGMKENGRSFVLRLKEVFVPSVQAAISAGKT